MFTSAAGRAASLLIVGLLFSVTARPVAASGTLDPASIRETNFPNGLRLLVKEDHAANLVALQYWVRTGGFRETAHTRGAAHFIEHLIFKGTDRYPAGGIDAEIEDLGGVLNAVTEKDWVMFGTTVASQFAGKALEVLGDAVRHPKFRSEDLETERRVIAEEVAAERLEPDRMVVARLFGMAFTSHPYGSDVLGSPEAIGKMTRAVMQQFFADEYTPSNATVVIVGDVDGSAVVSQVRAAFGVGQTPGTPVPAKLPATDPPPITKRETIQGAGREAFLGIGFPAPAVTDKDVHSMDILVTLLEQGTFGRLPAALAGIASGVKTTFETRRQPGLLTIVASCPPAAVARVEQTVTGVLRDLTSHGPTPAELLATKSLLAGSYATDNETYAGQANTLGYYTSIDRWQFAADYLPNLARVTTAQVRDAAAKYLDPTHSVTVVMLPRGDSPPGPPLRATPPGPTETRR